MCLLRRLRRTEIFQRKFRKIALPRKTRRFIAPVILPVLARTGSGFSPVFHCLFQPNLGVRRAMTNGSGVLVIFITVCRCAPVRQCIKAGDHRLPPKILIKPCGINPAYARVTNECHSKHFGALHYTVPYARMPLIIRCRVSNGRERCEKNELDPRTVNPESRWDTAVRWQLTGDRSPEDEAAS